MYFFFVCSFSFASDSVTAMFLTTSRAVILKANISLLSLLRSLPSTLMLMLRLLRPLLRSALALRLILPLLWDFSEFKSMSCLLAFVATGCGARLAPPSSSATPFAAASTAFLGLVHGAAEHEAGAT